MSSRSPQREGRVLENGQLAWRLEWGGGVLRSTILHNGRSGRSFPLTEAVEVALTFSAAADRLAEPCRRVADFGVREVLLSDAAQAVFRLHSPTTPVVVDAHYRLEGSTRRKWLEIRNEGDRDLLLLDVALDDFAADAAVSGGGEGQPLFLGEEAFAAIEHPAGHNGSDGGRVRLSHHPGKRLQPGDAFRTHTSLVSVAPSGEAGAHFLSYIRERSRRPKKVLSVYTPFGINNQWGACPTLDDEQALGILDLLEEWQRRGVRFDYFTLDTGWSDPGSDLARFRPVAYPDGPGRVVERVRQLGMKLGLWFATSWAAESCWDYPPAWDGQERPAMTYRNGYPAKADYSGSLCFAADAYVRTIHRAVLHHIRENGVRFVKLDGGNYRCDCVEHGHLPGQYSTERMYENLIALADAARAEAPDLFVMWYWGLRSPFWALHGDTIFESGLHMEGSGTSVFPAVYYRDSVTLAQDQNAQNARTVPQIAKDSLGVWLSDTRWGNYMGKERWREALVMDLARGNLLFPNLWGNLYHLAGSDVEFLASMSALARESEAILLQPRVTLGDVWRNAPYGYAYFLGARGLIFLNNAHFAARKLELRLDASLGIEAATGTPFSITSRFPDKSRLMAADGSPLRVGDAAEVWLRPFEVLLLECSLADGESARCPVRSLSEAEAAAQGISLALDPVAHGASIDVRFADAARFQGQGLRERSWAFEAELPSLEGEQRILAVPIRLRRGDEEWRYSPAVVEIVQAVARVGDQTLQLVPVPDARQFGNTQKAGCSWVLYKTRLSREWSCRKLRLSVHAYLPEDGDARVEAWVVARWWREDARPVGEGYYADAPS